MATNSIKIDMSNTDPAKFPHVGNVQTTGGAAITIDSSVLEEYSKTGAVGQTLTGKALDDYRKSTSLFSNYRLKEGPTTGSLLDACYNIPEGRRTEPLSYIDNVNFPHRVFDFNYNFRLGDCQFTIPPEFIQVKTITETSSVVGLRQTTAMKKKSGYSRKQIVVTLFFNGLNQINGYQCESIDAHWYYMDGLRSLLAQFKRTPFLPVINELLNGVHGIYNVALSNITINTIQGFPECLQAELTLLDFNVVPYIEAPPFMYHNMIDWDMFRWYYQQLMKDNNIVYSRIAANEKPTVYLKPVMNKNLTGNFKLSILSEEALAAMNSGKYKEDLSDSSNYVECISDGYGIRLTDIFCGYSNVLPAIQLSKEGTPTYQFLGGTDAVFTLIFETQDRGIVTSFVDLNETCQRMIRNYRKLHGIGFVKVENELVQMLGAQYVMFNSMDITTVPDFPGLFRIQIEAVSYDIDQSKKETLTGMKPFSGTGTLTNRKAGQKYAYSGSAPDNTTITNTYSGLITKIRQDNNIEYNLKHMDLYPDLQVPTFQELDTFIRNMALYRKNNKLAAYPLGAIGNYPSESGRLKYADPDFYVFYPLKYSGCENIFDGSITGGSYTVGANGQNSKAQEMLRLLNTKVGCGYTWGTSGEILTSSSLAALKKKFGASHYDFVDDGVMVHASKWIGKQTFDCSGFICWGLREVGIAPKSYRTSHEDLFNDWCDVISKSEAKPGDLAMNSDHIVMISGDNQTIEAMGTAKGVCHGTVGNRFTKFGRIKGGSAPGAGTQVVSPATVSSAKRDKYNPTYQAIYSYAKSWCDKLGIPIRGAGAMMQIESDWTQWSPSTGAVIRSPANAVGICQVVHHTPEGAPVNNQYNYDKLQNNWQYNIECGMKELAECYKGAKKKYSDAESVARAAWCAYNQGRGAKYAYNRWEVKPNGDDAKFKSYYENQPWLKKVDSTTIYNGDDSTTVATGDLSVSGNFSQLNLNPDEFGKDVYKMSDIHGGVKETRYFTSHKQDVYPVEHMCHDMVQNNRRGRLLRAFPTFLFMMLDENGDWLDGKKLWTNYYSYRSLMDIQIHQSRKQPAHTAVVKISNVYNNLGKSSPREYDWVRNQIDGTLEKRLYDYFGIMIGTPKVTQEMVTMKNKTLSHVFLDAGCRIHIRLGYGNDADMLPISFTGQITEMDTDEIITFVAQSDGTELMNRAVGTNSVDQTNTLFNLGTEPSNIIKSLLCDRESNTLAWANRKWFENSKYGIQHFGMPTLIDDAGMLKGGKTAVFGEKVNSVVTKVKEADSPVSKVTAMYSEAMKQGNYSFNPATWFETIKLLWAAIATLATGSDTMLYWNSAWDALADKYGNLTWVEYYDIIKNIYLGGVKGDEKRLEDYAAIHMNLDGKNAIDPFDGEENLRVFIYNKCVWDIMQVITQSIPEYVCQPMYHQFDTRVFFGHPYWMAKYKYYYASDSKIIYERQKPFTQLHLYDSLCDIIDNQIKVSSKDLATNIVGSYTLGHSLKTTPTIFADKTIAWDYQKTRVIDTSFVQNWFGPDLLYELFDDYKAEKTAIRIGTSNLVDSFQCIYNGQLIVIGDPSVKPCDTIGITDNFTGMYGIAEVREVVQSFGMETGFVTSITPDLFTTANGFMMKQDAQSSLLSIAMGFAGERVQRETRIFAANNALRFAAAAAGVTVGLLGIRIGGIIISGFRTAKLVKDTAKYAQLIKDLDKVKDLVKEVKNIKTTVTAIKGTMAAARAGAALVGTEIFPGVGTAIAWLAATIATECLMKAIVDFFSYQNCIKCFPLLYNGKPFISGVKGHTQLIPGYSDIGMLSDSTNTDM